MKTPKVLDEGPPMARKQWRCFFCDEVFTRFKDAAEHFGRDDACEADVPACKIAAHEGHLVHYIRKLEDELRRYVTEDSDVMRSIMTLESEHAAALRQAEERGYARGVQDMKAQGYCVEPQAHRLGVTLAFTEETCPGHVAAERDPNYVLDAPGAEIEVTPAMAYAGVMEYLEADPRCEQMEEVLSRVFLVMWKVRESASLDQPSDHAGAAKRP